MRVSRNTIRSILLTRRNHTTLRTLLVANKPFPVLQRRIDKVITHPAFQKIYLIGSITILAITTILWALFGSLIQANNADQLVNSYLTESSATFQGAILPDQHSFLLKLPFFWLVQLLGGNPAAFSLVTILLALITVGLLAFMLYRLQRRPFIIGTIYLALALVLMMIPVEPYSNSLLPTNMAMLTTRNLEYVVFIAAIWLTLRAGSWKSKSLILAAGLLALLVASDKLFLSLSIGGAILFTAAIFIFKRSQLRLAAFRWLAVSIVGSIAAFLLLRLLVLVGFIHFDSQTIVGPYGLVQSFKGIVFALFYGAMGIFTNLGANLGYDSRTITDFPGIVLARALSPFSIVFIGTLTIFAAVIVAFWKQLRLIIKRGGEAKQFSRSSLLTLILITTSLAALGVFIISNHYYPVDARYLAIIFFAGFIALSAYPFQKHLPIIRLVFVGGVLALLLIPATLTAIDTYEASRTASQELRDRNTSIAKTLAIHPVQTLLGDYWRVLPIKSLAVKSQMVTPLSGCSTLRPTLTSTAWQPDLEKTSFAYLLTLSEASANFPSCSLSDVTDVYGRPDSSVVVRGTPKDPKEILLFYDQGIHKTQRVNVEKLAPQTVVPVALEDITTPPCDTKTIMNLVAHEDDDILFMNPDLYHDIQAGNCIRSVFVTAGDAGADAPYWLGRQRGAEAAYASMLDISDIAWTERVVELSDDHFATIANPRNNSKLSLVFLHLPDGNVSGHGFTRSKNQSLASLYKNQLLSLSTVDNTSRYSSSELTDALVKLMQAYKPNEIRAQSAGGATGRYADHSDHVTVGQYAARATNLYKASTPSPLPTVKYYQGYPIHGLPQNVSGADLEMKIKTFLTFGSYDGATCHAIIDCDTKSVYGIYLRRQYTSQN